MAAAKLILTFEPSLIKLFKAFRSLGVILIAHKTARTRIIGQNSWACLLKYKQGLPNCYVCISYVTELHMKVTKPFSEALKHYS